MSALRTGPGTVLRKTSYVLLPALLSIAFGPAGIRAAVQASEAMAPLPAEPPIGGFGWTVVIPAILLLGSFLGTYLLYRRFSREEGR
jgi:hypothetical protein